MKDVLSAVDVRQLAAKLYGNGAIPKFALPDAIRELDAKSGRRTIGLVSPVYWRIRGTRTPLAGKTRAGKLSDLRKRRIAGERFEVLAAAASAAFGGPVSVEDVKDLLRAVELDPETSYAGRGTRKSAAGEAARTVTAANAPKRTPRKRRKDAAKDA